MDESLLLGLYTADVMRQVDVTVFTLAPAGEYAGDAKLNLDILDKLGVDVREAFDAEGAPAADAIMIVEMADVVVDAISTIMMASAAGAPSASNASRTSTPSLSSMSRSSFASPAYSPALK